MSDIRKTKMEIFYCSLFWILFIITLSLTGYCLYTNNLDLIKNASLPLLGLIFTIGQLWQNETKLRFEKRKHKQSRKDLFFDKRMEIKNAFNDCCGNLSSYFLKTIVDSNELLEFDYIKCFAMLFLFNSSVLQKAELLFSQGIIQKIKEVREIAFNTQEKIQIMQKNLKSDEVYSNSEDLNTKKIECIELFKELEAKAKILDKDFINELKIEEQINA
ncbi:MAG: hypothetical protein WCG95_03795 [bacterium]